MCVRKCKLLPRRVVAQSDEAITVIPYPWTPKHGGGFLETGETTRGDCVRPRHVVLIGGLVHRDTNNCPLTLDILIVGLELLIIELRPCAD